jgi:hypothetical protein
MVSNISVFLSTPIILTLIQERFNNCINSPDPQDGSNIFFTVDKNGLSISIF